MDTEKFRTELMDGERIYWTGQPDPAKIFSATDIFFVPFSFLWGGFAIFWEASVLGLTHLNSQKPAPFFFMLWGIPFVCIGLYMIVGRFFYKVWKKKRTWYAVTDKRVLILNEGFSRSVQAAFINSLPSIEKKVASNGSGSLVFGTSPFFSSAYINSGMDFLSRSTAGILAFFDIADVDQVYQLIQKQRSS